MQQRFFMEGDGVMTRLDDGTIRPAQEADMELWPGAAREFSIAQRPPPDPAPQDGPPVEKKRRGRPPKAKSAES